MMETCAPTPSFRQESILARDLLRDFCAVHSILIEQSARFAHSQTISYAVLRELLGEASHKGVFWRLKDTAHHLFRKNLSGKRGFEGYGMSEDIHCPSAHKSSEAVLESMLDWCIGYAFHECVKLKEDAFQRQHYTNRLSQLQSRAHEHTDTIAKLIPFTEQTTQSIDREIQRVLGVLNHTRHLLLQFYVTQGNNGPVARFLATEDTLAKQCFGEQWADLMHALYGQHTEQVYLLAITACLDGGHPDQAQALVEKARAQGVSEQSLHDIVHRLASAPQQVSRGIAQA